VRVPSHPVRESTYVSSALRTSAEWSWRFIVVVAGVVLLVYGLSFVSEVAIPALIAMLVAALLLPVVSALHRIGVPQVLAALVTLLAALAVLVGLVTLVGTQAASGFSDLSDSAVQGVGQVETWLKDGPLNLSTTAISGYVTQAQDAVTSHRDTIVSGAVGVASTAGHLVAGFFIAMFASFFYLLEGRRIWSWLLRLLPAPAQRPLDHAARQSWVTLTHYMRATIIVALVDGAGVAIGAAILQVPLAVPLGLVVFLGAFIPIVGAVLAGTVAVLVALVAHGPVTALVMLLVVILVQQVESHGLQPFLMGRAVAVHPLAVILAVASGATVFGIVGALFAVPLVAVLKTGVSALARGDDEQTAEVAQIDASDAPLAPDTPERTPTRGGAAEPQATVDR